MKNLIGYTILIVLIICMSLVVSNAIIEILGYKGNAGYPHVFLISVILILMMDVLVNKSRVLKNLIESIKSTKLLLLIGILLISISLELLSLNIFEQDRFSILINNILAENTSKTGSSNNVLEIIIFSVFFLPITEELIFRGGFQGFLIHKVKKNSKILSVAIIILISVLFAISHPGNYISRFIAGLFFGTLYYFTKNILYSIVSHIVSNLTITVVAIFAVTDLRAIIFATSGANNDQYYIKYYIILIFLAGGLLFGKYSMDSRTEVKS